MMVLVTYDVNVTGPGGTRRLRRVARACKDWGQRVQFSVFEVEIEPADWVLLRARLETIVDLRVDSLRYYFLGQTGAIAWSTSAPSRSSTSAAP